ncbi:hypothetical protein NA57DRAFT_61626 [Rhizodiscina lignyota]|uniref:2EXR domain-containing protein n=1 Tax=Rhizodiscina lignyota TaxID=1504668 RepID=A0A9P4I499_9PEZI|nr:hypothetical protein NA57DRAFT_61626 [Rhizodiscina lignyota]
MEWVPKLVILTKTAGQASMSDSGKALILADETQQNSEDVDPKTIFPFMKLPQEIRDEIYALLEKEDVHFERCVRTRFRKKQEWIVITIPYYPHPTLLRICRQIQNEALKEAFRGENTVIIDELPYRHMDCVWEFEKFESLVRLLGYVKSCRIWLEQVSNQQERGLVKGQRCMVECILQLLPELEECWIQFLVWRGVGKHTARDDRERKSFESVKFDIRSHQQGRGYRKQRSLTLHKRILSSVEQPWPSANGSRGYLNHVRRPTGESHLVVDDGAASMEDIRKALQEQFLLWEKTETVTA